MYCKNCGNEVTVGNYCTNCGSFVGANTEIVEVEAPLTDAQRLKKAFTSKLFFVISILASVSIGLAVLIVPVSFLYTFNLSFDGIPDVLIPIFALICVIIFAFSALNLVGWWKTYSRNKKSEALDASGPKLMYIYNKISIVIIWIMAVLFVILGIAAIAVAIMSDTGAVELNWEAALLLAVFGVAVGIIGVVYIVILLLYYRKLVKLFKQIAESAESGVWKIDNAKSVYIWTLVLGIISAAGGISSGGLSLVSAASTICLSFWIKENFVSNE